ncbi:cytochrome P450 [Dentipellis sp. KUC8613]|nr:cytochrome P450 [Dentipellis sp. KUC8613]
MTESSSFNSLPLAGYAHNRHAVLVIFVIGIVTVLLVRHIRSPYRKLPPGPTGLPVFGNLLTLANRPDIAKFTEWKKTYGDLIHFSALGQRIIVITSNQAAVDLLEHRSGKYSDRPQSIVANTLTGGHIMVLKSCDAAWRRHRRAANDALKKDIVHQYRLTETTEAIVLASDLLACPEDWKAHFRRRAASLIISIVYDHPPIDKEDTDKTSFKKISEITDRLILGSKPGEYLVDLLPWMVHIPRRFAKWRRFAEEHFKNDSEYLESLVDGVKERMTLGTIRSCFTTVLVENMTSYKLTSEENAWLAGTMYIGGTETSATMLPWFLKAMLLYPNVQQRAQDELDAVVGRSRAPTFADFDQLPYIQAMVHELLRWRSPTLFGFPRSTSEDDWYNGMFIPKGTICLPHAWLLNRDPELFGPDAADFNPARYLDETGRLKTDMPEHLSFGFGKRVCVGKHVANDILFIDIALVLWSSNIERVRDPNGEPVPMDKDGYVEHGIVVNPLPFDCKISPRFPEVSSILDDEKELRGI